MKALVNARIVFPDHIHENGTVLMENGKILACGDVIAPSCAEIIDAKGAYVGPGLIDIHCHGYAEVGNPKALGMDYHPAEATRAHLRHGTTSITPSSSYSWTKEEYLAMIQNCREDMKNPDSPIIGLHFEGPFINPNYGARSDLAWKYDKKDRDEIFDAAGDLLRHVTYAPEMDFSEEFEKYMVARGVIPDVGHCQMDPASCERAVKNGAKIVTHLYDAMGCWRGDDTIGITGVIQETAADVALAIPGLYYELICDYRGVHVKPYNMRLTLRCAGPEHVILVTDCSKQCSHNPADYPEDSPMSAPDLNYNDHGQLSASRLTLSDGVRNFKRHTGCDMITAFRCGATNAAEALGMQDKVGSVAAGLDANLLVVDEDFNVQAVYFHGEAVK